jgi:hypothetical protein
MEKCFLFVGNPPSLPYGDAAVVVVASLTQLEWEGNGTHRPSLMMMRRRLLLPV